MAATDWFSALGQRVHSAQRFAAVELLDREGWDRGEAAFVVAVAAREIEHDHPQRAFNYVRSFVTPNETMVYRVLATLASPTPETFVDELRDLLAGGTLMTRICMLLPMSVSTVSRLMLAVDKEWPGAVLADPTDEERSRATGEIMVFEVNDD